MQSLSTTQLTPNSSNLYSKSQPELSANVFIGSSLLIPLIFFAGFKLYKKHRSVVLRQQIATLEKVWHLDIKKRA
ncbi:hypothetical protein FNW02_09100 [Komarekiella sp. 'clone 1']|uniref:Uncharacterized protein n=1 Tax=Komarekiella delphini-convector SJRDD-AB1 TaxID=2593771 RepID=A0AA40SVD5_9NOST|nr:hypothetical protein [Komarekiella delphini-convector]MBD6615981.1 hypothetical protein [Komarekiella delphini-convector SJRDD-AB1]